MSETIKGISVLIEGETTGLTKALANVNRSSRDIQGELRQVERLLRLDPTNTELIAQKQQLLTNAVANTKEKLDSLKQAQEQVNQQFARGEINEGQYRAFQREIAATEQQLRRYEDQLNNTRQATDDVGETTQKTGEKFKDIGDKVKGAGEKMSVAVTAPIVAAGGVMLKGAVDAQTAQNKLQASLGITAEEAKKLGAVAREVWKDGFGESIEEANGTLTLVRKNMANLGDNELKTVAENAMTISEIFEQDVGEVTAAAGVAMKSFGISGQEALDLMTVGFQKGGDYSGELIDTLREYSPQFASMGISADQMMGILISGAQAGAWNLDKVGDSVKEFNLRAQDGSKGTAEGFAAIGLSAEEMGAAIARGGEDGQKAFMATVSGLAAMKDPVEQNAAGVALFGTQWEDVRAKVIIAMADGMKGIEDFKGATDEAAKAMYENNPGRALTQAMRGLQDAIGPALLPLADIITNTVVPAIKTLADGFSSLSPAGQTTVLAIVGIIAILGPALVIIGSLITAVGTIIGVFTAASAAIAGAGGVIALLTGPIGIAIAAIAAIIAIGVALYKNWNTIKAFAIGLKDGVINAFTAMGTGVSNTIAQIKTSIVNGLESALDWVSNLPGRMSEYGKEIINGLIKGIQSVIGSVSKVISDLAETIKEKIRGALRISSPSKVMVEVGEYTGQGLVDGMKNTIAEISRQSQRMAEAAIPRNPSTNYDGSASGNVVSESHSFGALLHADKVVISNDIDIQEVANKLGFYWRQTTAAKGGR